jgi:ADYC domain
MMNGRAFPAALALAPLLTAVSFAPALPEQHSSTVRAVEVDGTEFKVTFSDRRTSRSSELVGATLDVGTRYGLVRLHIAAVERDPDARYSPIWLHTFSIVAADGSSRNLCEAGPDGRQQGFPLAMRSRADGAMEPAEPGVFELVCTAGARGKCVRFGYLPWISAAMRDMYNACVRMVRADYCGDGKGTTRTGTMIDYYDNQGIQQAGHDARFVFEAGWTAAGAVCVRHVRIKENTSLERLAASCPRLRGRLGENCTEESARAFGATVFVRSVR